jgi:glucokinase
MAARVLAGDVGGTKTNLALYAIDRDRRLSLVREQQFHSADYSGLEKVVRQFLAGSREKIAAAAFGVAGPVLNGRVKTTNLPWVVRATSLARAIGSARVRLLNDLEATAYGGLFAGRKDVEWLAAGSKRAGNIAVIAAGTGLGQALLYWDGERHRPVATEGGHADFAPRNDKELALLVYLQKRFARVSYERVLSGPGLVNIFSFLADELGRPVSPEVRARLEREDPGAVIGEAGLAGACSTCREAVDTFVSIYGAQAGNLALTVMATGGVLVGGGIAVKLLRKMKGDAFVAAFVDKGRYREFMSRIPIGVLLDPKTALVGAGHAAAELVRSR